MRLPQIAVKNHHFTIVIVVLLTVLGLYAFLTMPRAEDPQISAPGTSIRVVYPGANPVDLEQLVVDPIEEAINEIEDIKTTEAYSTHDLAGVDIEFQTGVDMDEKYREVVEKVNSIRSDLPPDILALNTFKWEVGTVAILQLALVSETASYRTLKGLAEEFEDSIEAAAGVRNVDIHACPETEVHILADFERMARMSVPYRQLIGAVQNANASIPGGTLNAGGQRFTMHTSGMFQSLDEIGGTVVSAGQGRLVYLRDVAEVTYGYEEANYIARFNGARAVFITVSQKNGTNIFDVMKRVKFVVGEQAKRLPASVGLETVFDQSESVSGRLQLFFSNLLQGMALVGLVVLLGVGLRASIVVMMAIPLSLCIGIGFVDLSGYALEQISIAGLVIVLGILVDNAIVVTANVSRYIGMGHPREQAAILGTSEIGWAVTSATATTLLAFIPLILMQDMSGDFIRSLPVTVVFTLAASLLIALTFTPYLASKLLKGNGKTEQNRRQRFFQILVDRIYGRLLTWSLKHALAVILIALAILAGSVFLFQSVGVSFFPKAEKPQFLINIYTPQGSGLASTDETASYIEGILSEQKEIKHYAANIGRGNPRIYYNMFAGGRNTRYGQIYVRMKENDQEQLQSLIHKLRDIFSGYPGAQIDIREFEQGPPVEAPIAIKILAGNLVTLEAAARQLEGIFADTTGVISVYNPLKTRQTDFHLEINRDKAGLLGIDIIDIDSIVRASLSGITISRYRDSAGKDYDIVFKLLNPNNRGPLLSDLSRVYIPSRSGAQVPLLQVASVRFKASPLQIRHYNQERSVTLTADVLDGYAIDRVTEHIDAQIDAAQWSVGVRFHVAGELESREESFGGMGIAITIAIIAILAVLVLQFRSFSQPFIIFSTIPLAFIGSIVALYLTGNTFSFTAFVGLTSLVGIVVNNAIILVDYINQLIRQGEGLLDAIEKAGKIRFVPIILTTATTIGGLLPLTLRGGTLWAPMGWTIIGGLFTSTVLTLIIVPVLYRLFSRFSAKAPE